MSEKKRQRFCYEDEVMLAKEILEISPGGDSSKWEHVKQNMYTATGKIFSIRTLKFHIEHLVAKFENKEKADIASSGKEFIYSELDHLLEEIAELRPYKKIKILTPIEEGNLLREETALEHAYAIDVQEVVIEDGEASSSRQGEASSSCQGEPGRLWNLLNRRSS